MTDENTHFEAIYIATTKYAEKVEDEQLKFSQMPSALKDIENYKQALKGSKFDNENETLLIDKPYDEF